MPLTADEVVTAITERGISIIKHRTEMLFRAVGPDGGRLSRWLPDAAATVEEALATLARGEVNREEERQARAFKALAVGRYFQRMREVPVTDPDTGAPGVRKAWDIHLSSDNSRIVTGERSLIAAIVEAERVLAP